MVHDPKRQPKGKLRIGRQLQGLTQNQLANALGVTQPLVSAWEKGLTQPSAYHCKQLAILLKKSIAELGLAPEEREENTEQPDPPVRVEQVTGSEKQSNLFSPGEQSTHICWNMPYPRDPFFTGREFLLKEICRKFEESTSAITLLVLNGLAGIGKTHVAVEYVYRFQKEYQFVFWISADDLLQEVRRLASMLHLFERQEPDFSLVAHAVKQWFSQQSNWLVVFDNVEELPTLYSLLPQAGNGHIILTSTLPSIGFMTHSIEIPPMDLKDGTIFLLRRTKRIKEEKSLEDEENEESEKAKAIVEEMGGLSLAIDQAAAYIEEAPCSIGDYLGRYRFRRTRFLDRRGWSSTTHQLSLATTLSLSFEKVEQQSSAAVDLLRLCAFLHPQDIPEEMITEGAVLLTSSLRATVMDSYLFDEAIGALRKYALIRRQTEIRTLSLHRLVQVLLREGIEEPLQRDWAQQAVAIVSNILPPFDFAYWERFQRYIAQVQSCLALVDGYQMYSEDAAKILLWVGQYLGETSPYNDESESLLQQALELTRSLEAQHPVRLAVMNALAILYFNQERYQEAEPLLEETIEQNRDYLSLDNATSLNNLGEVYYMQARYAEAESLFLQALNMRMQIVGAEDPSVAMSWHCLAQLYMVQEKYEEAKPLFEQSLSIREQRFGREHLAVAESLQGLAELYL